MTPRILIVGCGIVGQAVVSELSLEGGLEIIVLDNFTETSDVHTLRDIDGKPAAWTPRTRISGFPGGNLNWGRNSSLAILNEPECWDLDFINQIQRIARKLHSLGFPRLKFKKISMEGIEDSFLVHENKPTGVNILLRNLRSKSNVKLLNGFGVSLSPLPNGKNQVAYRDTKNLTNYLECDFTIICAGTIGNQELLEKSNFIETFPKYIFDHPSFRLATLNFNRIKLGRTGLFGWSRIQFLNNKHCFTYLDKNQNILWTLRLFPKDVTSLSGLLHSLQGSLRAGKLGSFSRELFFASLSLVSGRILYSGIDIEASLDFLNRSDALRVASYSSTERIEYIEYTIGKIQIPAGINSYIHKILLRLRINKFDKFEFLQSNFISIDDLSSSSHHMSSIHFPTKTNLAFTEIHENIYVAGASAFPRSVPGHPTFLSAITGIYAAERIIAKIRAGQTLRNQSNNPN